MWFPDYGWLMSHQFNTGQSKLASVRLYPCRRFPCLYCSGLILPHAFNIRMCHVTLCLQHEIVWNFMHCYWQAAEKLQAKHKPFKLSLLQQAAREYAVRYSNNIQHVDQSKYFWIVLPYISNFQISFVLAQGSNLSIIQHKSVPERHVKYETKNKGPPQYNRIGMSW